MSPCIDSKEKVRVFISSAQNDENGFVWREVRKRIKNSLENCAFFNPFIIEDSSSATSSNQFFHRQVTHSDIIVLLVKNEVRNGTDKEFALATKLKKPLLVYFIKNDNPSSEVIKLKNYIQNYDICTYRIVDTFDDIETTIRKDLMDEIIRTFQDKYSISSLNNERAVQTEIFSDSVHISYAIPSNTEIGKFGSCYNYLYDLLKIPYLNNNIDKTEFHDLGCSLLSWLINGKWEIGEKTIADFISSLSNVFTNAIWLESRWKAICYYFHDNLEKALEFEEQALKTARETETPDWVINNILIDCRNIEIDICNHNHLFVSENKYQGELSTLKTMVWLPVIDRYLNSIHGLIEEDEFREETATPYAISFGSGLKLVMVDLANYLFTAAIYGTLTHLLQSRRILANILKRYANIHDESSFLFYSLKQFILIGNQREFNLFLNSTLEKQYSYVASQSDDIWKLTDVVPVSYRATMKLSVFAALGSYFSDDIFIKASEYILDYSDSVDRFTSESYLEALLANHQRMNPDQILRAIIPIIAGKRYILGDKLSHIVLSIDLNQVSEQILQNLSETLTAQLPHIISNNGDPQMIAPLVVRNKALFGHLETLEGNGLSGLQKSIYKINRGSEDWYSVIKEEIDCARLQFEQNSEKGVFHGFAYEPYSMISAIIRKGTINEEIENLLLNDFIPLSIDVLNSDASIQTKEPCVACLCEILSYLSEKNIELPLPVKQALQIVNVDNDTEDFFTPISRKALEIRVLMAQIIAGIVNENALLRWCIEYEKLEIKEKIVIIDCLEKYLYYKKSNLNTIDSLLVSIVLQCHSATHRDIRKVAVRCLAYLVSSKYQDIAIVELNKAVYDCSPSVRSVLLNVCAQCSLPTEFSNSLITVLCNDAHYCIRLAAQDLKNRLDGRCNTEGV